MDLICLGSGSSGNCYLLKSAGAVLVIEAGIKFIEVKKALQFNISSIAGVVVSHEHNDHAGHLKDFVRAGIRAVAPESTIYRLPEILRGGCTPAENGNLVFGGFGIYPIEAKHDVPCYAYVITHKDIGKLLFVTDTMSFPYIINGLNHIMIEADYDDETLMDAIDNGITARAMRGRLYATHLELRHTAEIVRRFPRNDVKEIVLLHLSQNNAKSGEFRSYMEREFGLPVYIAEKGLEIEL